jgi:hypothetical protein
MRCRYNTEPLERRISVLRILASLTFVIAMLAASTSYGIDMGFGVHAGYGKMKYKEKTNDLGTHDRSEANLDTILIGASAEYTLPWSEHLFIGVTTDWAWGLEDTETFKREYGNGSVLKETKDLSVFGQFYDGRFGYKNNLGPVSYRIYASLGWDGVYFRRSNFKQNGVPLGTDVITEDFSLWRIGGGGAVGYSIDGWTLEARGAYSYYFDGDVRNSNLGGIWFDTNGSCIDAGIGISRRLTDRLSIYAGGSYTRIALDESEVKDHVQFPKSETYIIAGMVNLTYAF